MSTSASDKAGRFVITPIQILERFLITGNIGATFRVSDKFATFNGDVTVPVKAIFDMYPIEALATLKSTIDGYKAPRRPPVLLALAAALNNTVSRKEAEKVAAEYIKSGTDQFVLTSFLRVWGRGAGRSFKRFASILYRELDTTETRDSLAMNLVKYRNRAGWTHRDALRMSHYKPSEENNDLFRWAAGKGEATHPIIIGHERAKHITDPEGTLKLLQEFPDLPWEALSTESLSYRAVWEALLPTLGYMALVRNLGRMSAYGIDLSGVLERITNPPRSIHPVTALSAYKVYGQGHGEKGSLSWKADGQVKEALNTAFNNSFKGLRSSDRKVIFALDVSGSMGSYASTVAGLNCREVSAAMMMAAMKQQPYMAVGFSHQLVHLDIQPDWSLEQVIKYVEKIPYGATRVDLPMRFAQQNKIYDVDMFAIYTDCEVNVGGRPVDALNEYRDAAGRFSKMAVVAAMGTPFSVADPNDAGMMDFIGMDASTPATILNLAES